MERIQTKLIINDLSKKMVFLAGPRQVGKTYLSKEVAAAFQQSLYLNYDSLSDRHLILEQSWRSQTNLLILDELHKMAGWKNYLKGLYDTKPAHLHILVTGSARLDIFDKIGDSLAGRYYLHRLLPLSLAELKQLHEPLDLERLMQRGGFPEPYLDTNAIEANRWRMQYSNSLLSTDIFEFDKVQNVKALRLIFELLRTRVGSPISYQSIAEDVSVSAITVKKYIEILEALYIVFRISPFSNNIARSLLKEPKIYFFDNGLVNNPGAQFENMVAVSLLKSVYARNDYLAEPYQLHYLRTKDGLEVDFALCKNNKIEEIIEAKLSDSEIDKSLFSFSQKYGLPATQLVKNLRLERELGDIKILKAEQFLSELYL
ncbi:MAG TPA: ATP-binding protein [Gammaproteobacteria bacterium]|jgi:predicted AAA+ superfamily ATPase|nr:ATP-binding protein [Gammaproteobacteria bacterium]